MTSKEAVELARREFEIDFEYDENNEWLKRVIEGLKQAEKDLEILGLLKKYEFKDVDELDEFLMEHIPMIYENGKWVVWQEWKDKREFIKQSTESFKQTLKKALEQSTKEKGNDK